jgi:hypothetical protein
MLDIRSCGFLYSFMWYTKWILVFPYFCYNLARTLSSSNPPSTLQWLDPSTDIGFLLVVGLSVGPLLVSETSVVAIGISSVVAMN